MTIMIIKHGHCLDVPMGGQLDWHRKIGYTW